jgi:hypothetical protein
MNELCGEATSVGNPEEWIVCTLFEGDYHFGLAALVNSLVKSGFQGCISAGYRGLLPPWIKQLKPSSHDGEYDICSGVRIKFIFLDTPVHFTNLKPEFMRQLVREQPGWKYIWYIDPDITIRGSWSFYVQWVKYGIALCEDVNGRMAPNHPLRRKWMELAHAAGLKNPAPLDTYYNAGFVGVPAAYSGFLDLWQDVIRIAESKGLDLTTFKVRGWDRMNPFYGGDQDSMNVAAMHGGYPLSAIGPEGMDFVRGGYTMSHPIGSPKPWRKNMVLSALGGVPPSAADKAFLAHLTYPIRPYGRLRLGLRRVSCRVGALVGRFYRRY